MKVIENKCKEFNFNINLGIHQRLIPDFHLFPQNLYPSAFATLRFIEQKIRSWIMEDHTNQDRTNLIL